MKSKCLCLLRTVVCVLYHYKGRKRAECWFLTAAILKHPRNNDEFPVSDEKKATFYAAAPNADFHNINSDE